jgi:hypothetical protein
MRPVEGEPFAVEAADLYELAPDVEVLARVEDIPCVWRKGQIVFVSVRSGRGDSALPAWLWGRVAVPEP